MSNTDYTNWRRIERRNARHIRFVSEKRKKGSTSNRDLPATFISRPTNVPVNFLDTKLPFDTNRSRVSSRAGLKSFDSVDTLVPLSSRRPSFASRANLMREKVGNVIAWIGIYDRFFGIQARKRKVR